MRRRKTETFACWLLAALMIAGCNSSKHAGRQPSTPEELRKYYSTPVEWVNQELSKAGMGLGTERAEVVSYMKQENYRVCTSNDSYLHAVVPNSKIHPGEQDIHILALFGSDGKVRQLQVNTQTTSMEDLSKDCR